MSDASALGAWEPGSPMMALMVALLDGQPTSTDGPWRLTKLKVALRLLERVHSRRALITAAFSVRGTGVDFISDAEFSAGRGARRLRGPDCSDRGRRRDDGGRHRRRHMTEALETRL